TKGFIVPPWFLGTRWAWPSGCSGVRLAASRCGHRPAQCRDEPIHPVPVAAVEAVRQELHDETHEDGPWETVLHAGTHDLRPLDEAGEDLAHREVAAQLVGEDRRVGPQRLLHRV